MDIFMEEGHTSLIKYGEELCGDCVESSYHDDKMTLVLADGLGSGVKANILSTLTAKIICTMMAEGLNMEECVSTIASTLPVCAERRSPIPPSPFCRWGGMEMHIWPSLTIRRRFSSGTAR